eukprot:3264527-Prymnesium_polylepis.1
MARMRRGGRAFATLAALALAYLLLEAALLPCPLLYGLESSRQCAGARRAHGLFVLRLHCRVLGSVDWSWLRVQYGWAEVYAQASSRFDEDTTDADDDGLDEKQSVSCQPDAHSGLLHSTDRRCVASQCGSLSSSSRCGTATSRHSTMSRCLTTILRCASSECSDRRSRRSCTMHCNHIASLCRGRCAGRCGWARRARRPRCTSTLQTSSTACTCCRCAASEDELRRVP